MSITKIGQSFITPNTEQLEKINNFIQSLSSETPIFLKVNELNIPNAKPLECFRNVEICMNKNLGTQQLGWIIWYDSFDRLITAEAHCVLKTCDGKLVDVTPQADNDEFILFIPDNNLIDDGKMIPCKYYPIKRTSEILSYIRQQEKAGENCRQIYEIQHPSPKPLKVGRNEPCPCGSSKKYKKCCGAK